MLQGSVFAPLPCTVAAEPGSYRVWLVHYKGPGSTGQWEGRARGGGRLLRRSHGAQTTLRPAIPREGNGFGVSGFECLAGAS